MMTYNMGEQQLKNWIVAETRFNAQYLGKCEAIMCLGNGYMGVRSATEERYGNEKRDTFVAGTFNCFHETEVCELPNSADCIALDIFIDNTRLDLEKTAPKEYIRYLNLKTAELTRRFVWGTEETGFVAFESKRFVSLSDLHLMGQKLTIRPLTRAVKLSVTSGIDGQQTNSGVQHFTEGDKRFYENRCLQLIQTTTQSHIDFITNLVHKFTLNNREAALKTTIGMDRRRIYLSLDQTVDLGDELVIEKLSTLHTSRDKEWVNKDYDLDLVRSRTYRELIQKARLGYDNLAAQSAEEWGRTVWQNAPIEVESKDGYDQLAIRFAQYHLRAMTPAHDHRMNIGAKGLSGEGYKGHTFWDTEIFMLPYFTWCFPEIARSLLEYRYLSLPGAHRKAKENGYEGAMFPWESAWLDDGETTPVWGAADIITGKPTKIWSGFIEQHITSDVVFGVWQYYQVTGDQDFMDRYGYEIILDAAIFWATRLEWNEDRKLYGIHNVVGPDEYKEHVNNNAFTNYTAHWTIKKAMEYCVELEEKNPCLYNRLDSSMNLSKYRKLWQERISLIYLPKPNENQVLPQDDTYLSKKNIDLTPYKNQKHVGSLFKDYNLDQVNDIQVSKQADVLLLFYLLEDLFDKEVKLASWNYYEPRTLHDSSLSLSTHSVLASDLGNKHLAYELFKKAAEIDLGPDMKTSDHGIHAASLGGVWQCVVNGFGGVRMLNGKLRINPHLPEEWESVRFRIQWRGDVLCLSITHDTLTIVNETAVQPEIELEIRNEKHVLKKQLSLSLK
ncbi:MAG: glycoside hydrolase family 65 protein [Clostridia bacterium]|nr:glycoside hydrolase family 65 protein [Clostridia bacterium]